MTKTLLFAVLALSVPVFHSGALAQQPKPGVKHHALYKVAKAAALPVLQLPKALGGIVFAVETGVDGAHAVLAGADKAFDAISLQGKIPVLDAVYAVVQVGDKDSGKLDVWLEKQEMYLFGTSN